MRGADTSSKKKPSLLPCASLMAPSHWKQGSPPLSLSCFTIPPSFCTSSHPPSIRRSQLGISITPLAAFTRAMWRGGKHRRFQGCNKRENAECPACVCVSSSRQVQNVLHRTGKLIEPPHTHTLWDHPAGFIPFKETKNRQKEKIWNGNPNVCFLFCKNNDAAASCYSSIVPKLRRLFVPATRCDTRKQNHLQNDTPLQTRGRVT